MRPLDPAAVGRKRPQLTEEELLRRSESARRQAHRRLQKDEETKVHALAPEPARGRVQPLLTRSTMRPPYGRDLGASKQL